MRRKNGAIAYQNFGELLHALGDIPPSRVRLNPPPGQATEADLLRLNDRKESLYELVEGTLVEKAMGYAEGHLATRLSYFLLSFVLPRDLGDVTGGDTTHRLMAGLVRLPDVSFTSWDRLPGRRVPLDKAIPDVAPNLAVEILSRKNTRAEITRKLKEYFLAGTLLAWVIDPRKRTVHVYTAPDHFKILTADHSLDGRDVLPGFALPLRELFAMLGPPAKKPRRR